MGLLQHAYSAATLALAISSVCAHSGERKSIRFKSQHPGAHFNTTSVHVSHSRDPYKVAQIFLDRLAYPSNSYIIRKDSYTDERTGISHIYVRQFVNGIEVADGDINLNIRDGTVLSHGNSFFHGGAQDTLIDPEWHQAVYCAEPTTTPNDHACGATLGRVQALASVHSFDPFSYNDPRAAVYFFLQAAHPDPNSVVANFHMFQSYPHVCTDPYEEPISCVGWSVTGAAPGLEPIQARYVYVQTPGPKKSTKLNLAWRLLVTLPDNNYEAYVSVHDPSKIIAVADWVVDAPAPDEDGYLSTLQRHVFAQQNVIEGVTTTSLMSGPQASANANAPVPTSLPAQGSYRVWKWGINDPSVGKRTLEKGPQDRSASPLGWHSVPSANDPLNSHPDQGPDKIVNFTTTIGNNAMAQENWDGTTDWQANGRPDGGSDLVFDFPYGADPGEPNWEKVEPRQYRNLSITQLFYTTNVYHDLLYLYGFDEASGNFQQYNFQKGGAEGDAIIVDAQDSGGFNNANFMTPPDGQKGRCRMYLWNTAHPFRDGALEAGIVIHELSHGLSTRLTGGPRAPSCLNTREAGGMGEGWGDAIATIVRSSSTYHDFPMGAWASDTPGGIRHFVYSTDLKVNPALYDRLQRADHREVHGSGEIWAQILFVVYNELIKKHGFADSLFPSSVPNFYRTVTLENGRQLLVPSHGNTLTLQLIVNGMKLQPCNPTFLQARDAIIQADQQLTNGENKCLLWKAFASRGMGTDAKKLGFATRPSINGMKVPDECN